MQLPTLDETNSTRTSKTSTLFSLSQGRGRGEGEGDFIMLTVRVAEIRDNDHFASTLICSRSNVDPSSNESVAKSTLYAASALTSWKRAVVSFACNPRISNNVLLPFSYFFCSASSAASAY